jgi:pre-rRNA-processing protein TSR2
VTNSWGGADSDEKRQWFVGATSDVVIENPEEDAEWIETFLLQVMVDEFEVGVEDDSALEVAEQIVRLRKHCGNGNFGEVLEMKRKWDAKGGKQDIGKMFAKKEGEGEDEDENEDDEDDEDGDEDFDMDEAPPLVRAREPVVAEVDEDGFTKVTKKR